MIVELGAKNILTDKQLIGLEYAVDTITDWFNQSSSRLTEGAVRPLIDLVPYIPYKGPLYRVFPIKRSLAEKIKEDQEMVLKTGIRKVQSWTATRTAAADFVMSKNVAENSVTVQLVSKAHQLLNFDYLEHACSVLRTKYVLKNKEINIEADVRHLASCLKGLRNEDEVILLMPPKSKVKIVMLHSPSVTKNRFR